MRLIDADKINFFDCLAKTGNSVCCHAKGIVSKEAIDILPTVDAIPVEWIKNKIAVNMYLWEEGKDKMFIENGVVEVLSYSLTAQTLSKLLELWEKENETNR